MMHILKIELTKYEFKKLVENSLFGVHPSENKKNSIVFNSYLYEYF